MSLGIVPCRDNASHNQCERVERRATPEAIAFVGKGLPIYSSGRTPDAGALRHVPGPRHHSHSSSS